MHDLWHTAIVVFRKECLDAIRDRRTLLAVLIFSLLSPGLMYVALKRGEAIADEAQHVQLAVVGAAHAPGLIATMQAHGVAIVEAPEQPEVAVRNKELSFYLDIPGDYAQKIRTLLPVEVHLVHGDLKQEERAQLSTVKQAINAHVTELGVLRLAMRGIAPGILRPLSVVEQNVAESGGRMGMLIASFVLLLFTAAFSGSMNVAIDSSAGERERGSLEPLLLASRSRAGVVFGKVACIALFASAAAFFSLITSAFVLAATPAILGRVQVSAWQVMGVVASLVVVVPLVASGQLVAYLFAKSYREAQVYASFLMMVPMFAGMGMMIYELRDDTLLVVPFLGQMVATQRLLSGDTIPWALAALGALLALLVSGICTLACARLLRREKVVFAR